MKEMKRLMAALLAAALCLCLCACGGSGAPAETPAPETQAPTEAPAAKELPAETPEPTPEPTPDPTPEHEPEKPDISAFLGLWKYDDIPYYLHIDEDFTWMAVNMYGAVPAKGTLEAEDDGVSLYLDTGVPFAAYRRIVGGLADADDGSTLTATDDLLLLPTPEDELTETASFSGDFSRVTISYPRQMSAHPHPNLKNTNLSFNALMEDGTDDYYSNILIQFSPISGFDPYMTQGAATAQPYMKIMLDKIAESSYGSRVLQIFGSDFKDCGSYYSMTGYLWLDSSIFGGDLTQPVRGCMEVRYYGPTGYALVATTVSLESRIRNYFDICSKMMESCNYDGGWSTAPKPVPAQPVQGSDSGDYGTPYYWYDEDGDVWYWNGWSNEFIGFGSDYYIDDDGNFYESNDDGWDPEDYDYYDDYDPWSDPGDGWDAWSDPGDGWDW